MDYIFLARYTVDDDNNFFFFLTQIYFWDERDGVQLRGWWVAPEVGGSNVWAMSTATSPMPPHSGWRVPWHGDVNKKVTLTKVVPGMPQLGDKRPGMIGGEPASKFQKTGASTGFWQQPGGIYQNFQHHPRPAIVIFYGLITAEVYLVFFSICPTFSGYI